MSDINERLDRLESELEDQQEIIEAQQATIDRQRERIAELDDDTPDDENPGETDNLSIVSRRGALTAGGLLALLFGGVGTASADAQGEVGTTSDPISALYTDSLNAGDAGEVSVGDSLDLDGNDVSLSDSFDFHINTGSPPYVAFTDASSTDGPEVRIDWDQNLVELDRTDLRIGDDGVVEDSTGEKHLIINSGGPLEVNQILDLTGNALTNSGGDLRIAGSGGNGVTITTDGGARALSLGVPTEIGGVNPDNDAPKAGGNVVAGHPNNAVNNGAVGVIIAGGGGEGDRENTVGGDWATLSGGYSNTASGDSATVGGGFGNTAGDNYTTVSGGSENEASSSKSTIGGGSGNTASGGWATVSGGSGNTASGGWATVSGGSGNTASGEDATVPGGANSNAEGDYSFATGRNATAQHDGAFVFGDSSDTEITSDGADEARFQMEIVAEEGVTENSSRAGKTNVQPLEPTAILEGVDSLEVSVWKYETDDNEGAGTTHIGPMAEDFHEAFGIGEETTINTIDRGGVTLAAIQGLSAKLDDTREELDAKDDRIEDQQDRIDALESSLEHRSVSLDTLRAALDEKDSRIDALEAETESLREENDRLREHNADLESRLARIEVELGIDGPERHVVADD